MRCVNFAHRFRTPLGIRRGFAHLLSASLCWTSQHRVHLEHVSAAPGRIAPCSKISVHTANRKDYVEVLPGAFLVSLELLFRLFVSLVGNKLLHDGLGRNLEIELRNWESLD